MRKRGQKSDHRGGKFFFGRFFWAGGLGSGACYSLGRMPPSQDVTLLLRAWASGSQPALDELTPLVYAELRRLAGSYLRREEPGHTLEPTALVHEAYLRLVDSSVPDWQSRTHFYGVAAHLMRQILVDHARQRNAVKRGGQQIHLTFAEDLAVSPEQETDLVALDDALERLAVCGPRKAQVVELRFFGGLSLDEIAEVLKVSAVTVRRDWQFAKAWLLRELSGKAADAP
jgi:RNA polymerase sigma-70 factor, ECF subfamily